MLLAIPATESLHVGVSDTYHSNLNATAHNAMVPCTTLRPPIPMETPIYKSCGFGTHGRYIYIYHIREDNANAHIELYELEVYMGRKFTGIANEKENTLLYDYIWC